MTPSTAQLANVAQLHERRTRQAAEQAARLADATFSRTVAAGGLDDATLQQYLDTAVPQALGAQRAAVVDAEAFQRAYLSLVEVAAGDPVPVEQLIGPALRSGTPVAEVYTRPMVAARSAISDGLSFIDALRHGARKAASLTSTDTANAARSGSLSILRATPQVVGYRRVPAGGACPFCLLIATKRYHVDDLAPVHAHCACAVAAITARHDPGLVIEQRALQALKMNDVEAARAYLTMTDQLVQTETGLSTPALPEGANRAA